MVLSLLLCFFCLIFFLISYIVYYKRDCSCIKFHILVPSKPIPQYVATYHITSTRLGSGLSNAIWLLCTTGVKVTFGVRLILMYSTMWICSGLNWIQSEQLNQ